MGQYLIPDGRSVSEALHFLGRNAEPDELWTEVTEGLLYENPTLTDAEAEALWEGFVSSGSRDWKAPLPFDLDTHIPHLSAYYSDPQAATEAEFRHVVKDVIRALRYLNQHLE